MDVTKQIFAKKHALDQLKPDNEIDLVLRHLMAAERRFESGKKSADREYFTDVIYRTNQVYEGILKELYDVVASKKAKNAKTHEMEAALDKAQALSPKVLSNFTTYRQDWRNPSTHDHRIDFDEQEAFTAILNVSAFCYVAIDQIVFSINQAVANKSVSKALSGKGFTVEGLAKALTAQSKKLLINDTANDVRMRIENVRELEGIIAGIISSLSPNSDLQFETVIEVGRQRFRPDFLINTEGKRTLIELATYRGSSSLRHRAHRIYDSFSRLIDEKIVDEIIIIAIPYGAESEVKKTFQVNSIEEGTDQFLIMHVEEALPIRRKPPVLDRK